MPNLSSKLKMFLILAENCWKIEIKTFSVMRYLTWKLEFVLYIFSMIVDMVAFLKRRSCMGFAVSDKIQFFWSSQRVAKFFIDSYWLRELMRLQFFPIIIYGHAAVAAPILRLCLIVEIHKLKFILKSLKPLKYRSNF